MRELTQQRLRELLRYDPETGDWTWLVSINAKAEEDDAAGTISAHGYRIITLAGVKHRASRLAFLYMTGTWPEKEVDHINRVKLDDRWENLRDVSRSENQLNRDLQSNNTSGIRGVHWDSRADKWAVQVKKDGLNYFGGYYEVLAEAATARDALALELHGDFAEYNETEH